MVKCFICMVGCYNFIIFKILVFYVFSIDCYRVSWCVNSSYKWWYIFIYVRVYIYKGMSINFIKLMNIRVICENNLVIYVYVISNRGIVSKYNVIINYSIMCNMGVCYK